MQTLEQYPEWIWYGEDDEGNCHVSTGRWAKKPCQKRYKIAEIQPTEHDHPTSAALELVTVAWKHPTSDWASNDYYQVEAHCLKVGPFPEPLVTRENAEQREAVLVAKCDAYQNSIREWAILYADQRDTLGAAIADLEAQLAAANATLERLKSVFGDDAVNLMQSVIDEASQEKQKRKTAEAEAAKLQEALQSIDNLDEAMGHNLTVDDAFTAVAIARQALAGKEGADV